MKNLTLKTRVLLGIMIPLVLVFAVMIFTISYQIQKNITISMKEKAQSQIKIHSEKVSQWIKIYQVWIKNLSQDDELQQLSDLEDIGEWLTKQSMDDAAVDAFAYSDTEGNGVAIVDQKKRFLNLENRSYFKDIIKNKKTNVTTNVFFLDSSKKTATVAVAHAVHDKQKNVTGLVVLGISLEEINKFSKEKITNDSVSWIIDGSGLFIAHPAKEVLLKARFQDMDTKLGTIGVDAIKEQVLAGKEGIGTVIDERGIKDVIAWHPVAGTPNWVIGVLFPEDNFYLLSRNISYLLVILMLIALAIITAAVIFVLQRLLQPIKNSVAMAQTIADLNLSSAKSHDENQYSQDEMGKLSYSMDVMANKLKTILQEISESSEYIASGSEQLNATSQVISNGASEQAATLEQVAASVVEMASSIQTTTGNAQKTETIAQTAASMADESGKAVGNTVESMNQIAEKIHVIQEIAGQTRLLSLNASIEAARAGNSGKGFAVVAQEVSKLAELSADAASNIEELTQRSVSVANEAGEKLKTLVPEIKKTTELVKNISVSSKEQNLSIEQVNISVQEVNNVVQHNATQAEELASSSENFSAYAEQLQKIVSQFKL